MQRRATHTSSTQTESGTITGGQYFFLLLPPRFRHFVLIFTSSLQTHHFERLDRSLVRTSGTIFLCLIAYFFFPFCQASLLRQPMAMTGV